MRISTSKPDPKTGSIDGAEGGVPIDDEEGSIPVNDDSDAFAVLDDEDDANPGDRRRDPLRRP
ncbi:MAG: hypothetical protein ACXV7D_16775 [Thermoanaerobaculia bacterium]